MEIQELIQPATPARKLWNSAPGVLASWTTEQILSGFTARVAVERKPRRYESRSTRLEPFRQTRIRDIAAPLPASHRWGVALAGGDGVRLRKLARWIDGEGRPKQFCQMLGERTLLEEARQRAERSFPAEQILFSLTRAHEDHYLPYWRTGHRNVSSSLSTKARPPAILAALARIAQADPDAIVSILPCDHYYSSESAFTAPLESSLEIAPIILREALFWKGMP